MAGRGPGNFIKQVLNYVLKEYLVDTLANSKWFQRFAVRTNSLVQEAKAKADEHSSVLKENLQEKLGESSSQALSFYQKFRQEFRQEFQKLVESQKQEQQQRSGKK